MTDDDQSHRASWRPIKDKPEAPTAGLLLCRKRTWTDQDGTPVSLGPIRDFAERVEVAFFEDGQWWETNTGHSVFYDCREPDDLPTDWMPLTEPSN